VLCLSPPTVPAASSTTPTQAEREPEPAYRNRLDAARTSGFLLDALPTYTRMLSRGSWLSLPTSLSSELTDVDGRGTELDARQQGAGQERMGLGIGGLQIGEPDLCRARHYKPAISPGVSAGTSTNVWLTPRRMFWCVCCCRKRFRAGTPRQKA